jgi:hypothetical protein
VDVSTILDRCASRYQDDNRDKYTDADWLAYINDAYNDVCGASPLWPFLKVSTATLSLATETRGVNLPDNVFRVTSVYNNEDQYPMRALEGDTQHVRHYPDQTLDGIPSRYRIFNNQLQVWPLPDGPRTFTVDYIVAPDDLGSLASLVVASHAGGAAGDITLTGIDVGDTLKSVVGVKTSDQSVHDFTSEFSIPVDDKINNTGGTATTGYTLVVTYVSLSTIDANTPVFPKQWHKILVSRALQYAAIDDAQPQMSAAYEKEYDGLLIKMIADLTSGQQDRNPEIVDNWW